MNLERRVEVYEAVLRRLNAFGNLVPNHEKMRELMVAIMLWQHAKHQSDHKFPHLFMVNCKVPVDIQLTENSFIDSNLSF